MAAAYTLQEGDRASAAAVVLQVLILIANSCPDAIQWHAMIAWAVVLIVAVQEDDVACMLHLC